MTTLCWAAFAVLSVLDWWAIARGARALEVLAKPGAMIALLGVALSSGALASTGGVLLLLALLLCLLGDVLLLGDSESRFLGGLGAFLLGHIAYAVLFVHLGLTSPWWGVVALVAVGCILPLAVRIVRGAAHGGVALGGAVTAYIAVISAMAALGAATGNLWLALGALVFVASDTILGFNRFVRALPWGPVGVMVTYLLAQGLLVHGALSASVP